MTTEIEKDFSCKPCGVRLRIRVAPDFTVKWICEHLPESKVWLKGKKFCPECRKPMEEVR